jgi:hypothetical protein
MSKTKKMKKENRWLRAGYFGEKMKGYVKGATHIKYNERPHEVGGRHSPYPKTLSCAPDKIRRATMTGYCKEIENTRKPTQNLDPLLHMMIFW